MGDVLAQSITGTPNLDVFRSVQLGAIGAGLDIFRQDIAGNAGGHSERIAKAAKSVSSQAVWAPLVACTFYAALKVVEGQPGEILQGIEVRLFTLRPLVRDNCSRVGLFPELSTIDSRQLPGHAVCSAGFGAMCAGNRLILKHWSLTYCYRHMYVEVV